MTQRFDDMAAKRDALYQALQPSESFVLAKHHDGWAAQHERAGQELNATRQRSHRDAELLKLAIRALTARQGGETGLDN